jgi:hypothetical protein
MPPQKDDELVSKATNDLEIDEIKVPPRHETLQVPSLEKPDRFTKSGMGVEPYLQWRYLPQIPLPFY